MPMLLLLIVKEAGFSISSDDLKNAQSEISDEELEGVAGACQFNSAQLSFPPYCDYFPRR